MNYIPETILRDLAALVALHAEIKSRWYQDRATNEGWEKCAPDLAADCFTIADAFLANRKN